MLWDIMAWSVHNLGAAEACIHPIGREVRCLAVLGSIAIGGDLER